MTLTTMALRRYLQTAKVKVASVQQHLLNHLATTDQKFLLFAHHLILLDAAEECLKVWLQLESLAIVGISVLTHACDAIVAKAH
jgi:hypothetical protein